MPVNNFAVVHRLKESISFALLSTALVASPVAIAIGQESKTSKSTSSESTPSSESESLLGFTIEEDLESNRNSPIDTRTYDITLVKQKLFHQLGIKGKQLEEWLAQRIKQTTSAPNSAQAKSDSNTEADLINEKLQPIESIQFHDDNLTIAATISQHQQIKQCLNTLHEYGLRQVVIQTKIIRLENDSFEDLPIDWTHIESVSKLASEQPKTTTDSVNSPAVMPASFEAAVDSKSKSWLEDAFARDQAGYRHMPPSEEFATPEEQKGSNWTQAISVIERSAPVLYTLLDKEQLSELKKHLEDEDDKQKILSPSLLVFSGQTAEVGNSRERPFVTSMKPFVTKVAGNNVIQFQPKVRVYPEGTTLRLRPELRSDHIQLACELDISEIKSVDTFDMPQFTGQGVFTVQIPEVSSTQFRSKMRIPIDYSLAICALEKDDKGKSVATLVVCTCKVHDFDEAERLWNQKAKP